MSSEGLNFLTNIEQIMCVPNLKLSPVQWMPLFLGGTGVC